MTEATIGKLLYNNIQRQDICHRISKMKALKAKRLLIIEAFAWCQTPEGYDFWSDICYYYNTSEDTYRLYNAYIESNKIKNSNFIDLNLFI